jgi:hypothetical protein
MKAKEFSRFLAYSKFISFAGAERRADLPAGGHTDGDCRVASLLAMTELGNESWTQ